jgi:hypothetical protein
LPISTLNFRIFFKLWYRAGKSLLYTTV